MEENKNNNTQNQESNGRYADCAGTGVLSTIIFMIVAIVGMYLLSKYLG